MTQTEEHHCLSGVSNRKNSEKYGLKINVCRDCHNLIHSKREYEVRIKQMAQEVFEQTYPREEWIRIFGKSWL